MRQRIDHILTPETERHFFQEQLLPPLLRGECATVMWFPRGGVKTQINFLANNAFAFGYSQLGKYKIFNIDPNELVENKPEGYFQLMLNQIDSKNIDKNKNRDYFFALKQKMQEYLKERKHLIFVFDYFDKLNFHSNFYNNLHSLYQLDQSKVHYVFVFGSNCLNREFFCQYDELKKLPLQNIIYFPSLRVEDSLVVASRINKIHKYGFSETLIKLVCSYTGGHPSWIRKVLAALARCERIDEKNILGYLKDQTVIEYSLREVWMDLLPAEKEVILQIVNGSAQEGDSVDYLLKIGFLIPEQKSLKLFSPLFEEFVKQVEVESPMISIDDLGEDILINNKITREKITQSENLLLSAFLKNPNKVLSRDKISEILWGDASYEKYSDWAIDQSIFKLRRKLKSLGIQTPMIQTIKGRGYRWLQL